MRPWIKRTLTGLFSAGVLLGGLTACGHGMRGDGWQMSGADAQKMRERMIDRVSRELTLDDAQKQRLGVLADKLREQRLALMGANPSADPRADLQQLIAGNTFDRTRAQQLVDEKTAAVKSKAPDVITALGDFYDSLRPDQQQKVRDFMAKHRRHRG